MKIMGKHCQVCNVYLPSLLAIEQHENGKKHKKMEAIQQEKQKLVESSVFLYGFPAKSFQEAQLFDYFNSKFGPVSKVMIGVPRGTFAIIEFALRQPAQEVLSQKKLNISGQIVLAKARELEDKNASSHFEIQTLMFDTLKQQMLEQLNAIGSLDQQFTQLAENMKIDDLEFRKSICQQLQLILMEYLPGTVKVELFGSSVNGLGCKGADTDITVSVKQSNLEISRMLKRTRAHLFTVEPDLLAGDRRLTFDEFASLVNEDKIRFLSKIMNLARKKHTLPISALQTIFSQRCPLVRFIWNKKYDCEISINNDSAIHNTKWIFEIWHSVFPAFSPATYTLQFWAKNEGVIGHDPHQLNTYSLILLLVTFLQNKGYIPTKNNSGLHVHTVEPQQLLVLLNEFFQFYSNISFKNTVVSPHLGQFISYADMEKDMTSAGFKHSFLNIQDPFVLSHNTAAKVAAKEVEKLRKVLIKTAARCTKAVKEKNLSRLFEDTSRPSSGMEVDSCSSADAANCTQGFVSPQSVIILDNFENAADLGCVIEALVTIFTSVLDFDVIRAEPGLETSAAQEPLSKRAKFSPVMLLGFHVSAFWASWEGRRLKRRAISRENPDFDPIQTELEITKQLKEKQSRSPEPIFVIDAKFEELPNSALKMIMSCSGALFSFQTFVHFLEPFLKKFVPLFCK